MTEQNFVFDWELELWKFWLGNFGEGTLDWELLVLVLVMVSGFILRWILFYVSVRPYVRSAVRPPACQYVRPCVRPAVSPPVRAAVRPFAVLCVRASVRP